MIPFHNSSGNVKLLKWHNTVNSLTACKHIQFELSLTWQRKPNASYSSYTSKVLINWKVNLLILLFSPTNTTIKLVTDVRMVLLRPSF